MVTVTVNGHKQVLAVKLDPEVVSKDDVEMLQDLIVAALGDAHRKVDEALAVSDAGHDGRPADSRAVLMARQDPLADLVAALQRLPGIGARSAQRLAYHLLKTPREEIDALAAAMLSVKDRVTYCSICSNITDVDPCSVLHRPTIATAASSASSSSRKTSRPSRRRAASAAGTTCSWARSRRSRASARTISRSKVSSRASATAASRK